LMMTPSDGWDAENIEETRNIIKDYFRIYILDNCEYIPMSKDRQGSAVLSLSVAEEEDLIGRVAKEMECRDLGSLAQAMARTVVGEVMAYLRDRADNLK